MLAFLYAASVSSRCQAKHIFLRLLSNYDQVLISTHCVWVQDMSAEKQTSLASALIACKQCFWYVSSCFKQCHRSNVGPYNQPRCKHSECCLQVLPGVTQLQAVKDSYMPVIKFQVIHTET